MTSRLHRGPVTRNIQLQISTWMRCFIACITILPEHEESILRPKLSTLKYTKSKVKTKIVVIKTLSFHSIFPPQKNAMVKNYSALNEEWTDIFKGLKVYSLMLLTFKFFQFPLRARRNIIKTKKILQFIISFYNFSILHITIHITYFTYYVFYILQLFYQNEF